MPMNRWRTIFAVIILATLPAGCLGTKSAGTREDWSAWNKKRLQSVGGTNGWSTLVGLHWLEEGPSTSGSDPANTHVFPAGRTPAFAGVWTRTGLTARFDPAPGVVALKNGKPFAGGPLATDERLKPDVLSIGSVRITVLKRGPRLALRVRDSEAPTRLQFTGIESYPFDPAWQIEARLERAAHGATLPVQDITGGIEDMPAAGTLVFWHDGAEHRLDAVHDEETHDLFVMFRDATTGRETYGAGRFLHVPKPGLSGRVTIDFNLAYTPPCAFTPYATCPLAPPQNRLPFRVEAGEKSYRH